MRYPVSIQQAFQLLEIEPTTDRRAIKKAYAQMVKKYHPEEYPQEWQKIHDAYEQTSAFAKMVQESTEGEESSVQEEAPLIFGGALESAAMPESVPMPESASMPESAPMPEPEPMPESVPISEPEPMPEPEMMHKFGLGADSEQDVDFGNISGIARQMRERQEEKWQDTLYKAMELVQRQCRGRFQTAKQWKKLLATPEVWQVRMSTTFLYRLGDLLSQVRIGPGCYLVIKKFLDGVHQDLLSSIFDEEVDNTNLEAWAVACKGMKRALKGRFAEPHKINKKLLLLVFVNVLLVAIWGGIFIAKLKDNRPEEVVDDVVEIETTLEDVLLCIKVADDGKSLMVDEASVLEEGDSIWDWDIAEIQTPPMMELAAEYRSGEVVACFVAGTYYPKADRVNVCVSMAELGLETGKYSVWGYGEFGYTAKIVDIFDPSMSKESMNCPYENEGMLYLNVELCERGSYFQSHPVVILREPDAK